MLVMIYFANKISWAWEVYDAFRDYNITFSEAYRATMEVIKESDLMGSYSVKKEK